ncbi:bifunctional metallophosphatase/5'-nucleotidase [Natribacillus halophilus]|uniref:2',3'-cyclic-nucleotide 2'-phosphodiesterase/5'-or 3'-nucleotidase, 5'-nucleotidase family n=1 Tax=Natribacillus halophilus TaxID=549003 RepID=A0A1G8RP51_9BACI|nr:bifunctional UDP-sugar hydrolase/5'-nucleotidase [Natribacillus halophilus]SDJ18170.1 2',3'-cyclic-nucleotide 2'-phosphodiesterase/5'-or 3'-nucleotidase, 5'-nucleotidase family [Natribacillus halophilus]
MASKQLYIYHTNDLHSQLQQWPKIVDYLEKQERHHQSRGEEALFFDLGDHADRVHSITEATSGRGNIDLLNASPIQYATIGNNEGVTFPKETLEQLYTSANFDVFLSNLYNEGGKRPSWAKKAGTMPVSSDGPVIGMMGLTTPFFPFYNELGWNIQDPFDILDEELPLLRQSADIVILLSHLGLFRDEQIASAYDVDVILGAHTHHRLDPAPWMNGTLITQTGKLGTHVGEVALTYDTESRKVLNGHGGLVSMEGAVPESARVGNKLANLQQEANRALTEVVASREEPLAISWTEPSSFSTFLVQQLRQWCQTDIAMIHSGLLLASLREGKITKGDLHELCPHPVNPCVVQLKGHQLKQAIHQSFTEKMIHLPLKGYGFRGYKLGRLVFAGLDVDVEQGETGTFRVNNIYFQGQEIDEHGDYEVATADMLTFGSLYPEIASSQHKRYIMPEFIRDIIAWGLKKESGKN